MKKIIIALLSVSGISLLLTGCGGIEADLVTRPADVSAFSSEDQDLVALGKQYWSDPSLSSSGALSCNTCHMNNAAFKDTFKNSYPHFVQMTKAKSGFEEVDAEQMVQFCLVAPMKTDPLPWDSKKLAALAAYTEHLQKAYAESR